MTKHDDRDELWLPSTEGDKCALNVGWNWLDTQREVAGARFAEVCVAVEDDERQMSLALSAGSARRLAEWILARLPERERKRSRRKRA